MLSVNMAFGPTGTMYVVFLNLFLILKMFNSNLDNISYTNLPRKNYVPNTILKVIQLVDDVSHPFYI